MPQHSASPSSVFIVRAIPRDEQVDYYASHAEEGFAAFHPASGPLHTSRFRNLIARFVSPAEAETFLQSQRPRSLERFQDIRIEPAPADLAASFLTMGAERRAALQQLLPLVERVLEVFDFTRVQRTMAALGWKYTTDPQSPGIEDLKSMARRLLVAAAEEDADHAEHTSGGFRAWRVQEKLYLTFAVETAHAEPDRASRL